MTDPAVSPERSGAPEPALSRLGRVVSILIAVTVCVSIIFYPRMIAEDSAHVPHGWLVMLLMGMSICWIHGFRLLTPRHIAVRLLPWVGWLFVAVATWKMFF